MIPEEVIREIRERTDIVAVIGQHVQLRKAGRNHKGLCPFHGEKTPSFNVNPDRGFFYCFGCQKKGDVFTFVMEYEGKSFHEAAEQLAAGCGVTIPRVEEPEAARRARSERAAMLEVNKLAAGFYAELLRRPAGAAGRAYLEGRGIGAEIAEAFQLGYAPAEWRGLADHLRAQRASLDAALGVGLLIPQQRAGGAYDRFRDRLMCPVIVPGGEVVGFSGRALAGDGDGDGRSGGAKYINSPESAVYKKSKLLFGLHRARDAFRRTGRAVLVEGNFDVISLHQAGFAETVAPLGTALTDEQVDQLRRLTERVVLFYDGDRAGRAATLRALAVLFRADLDVRIARLPAGDDPDSLVRREGTDGLARTLDRARPAFDYFVEEVWAEGTPGTFDQAKLLEEAAQLLATVGDPTRRELMVKRVEAQLAARTGVDVATVRRALARPGPGANRQPAPAAAPVPAPRSEGPLPGKEVEIIAILAAHPQLIEAAEEIGVFSLLTDARLRDMYSAALRGEPLVSNVAPLAERLEQSAYSSVSNPTQTLRDAAADLRRSRTRAEVAALQREAQQAGRRGDTETERQLVSKAMTLLRKQVD